jgi:hypothetical protein
MCLSSQLRVHLGRGGAAAGTTVVALVFVNRSARACSLHGYPGVSAVAGDDGHQVGSAASRNPGNRVATVVLRPGGVASALYGQGNPLNYPKARCQPVHVRGLRIYPPNERAALFLPYPHVACSAHIGGSWVMPVVSGPGNP